ncbi:MAG TPA: BatA and WFA domain-containing protein [Armatimonadota bacterium]|jgi:hypothetical protein
MSFQSATSLWWLLPLGSAILVLYLLKMRRRDTRVPAAFLWPRMTADVRANAPFQRLRPSVLLFLQLAILTLLVFGLANPLRRAKGLNGRATVVVLDASASMAATDVAPSRFEAARRRVEGIVQTMGSGDQLALVLAGPATRVAFPLSNDRTKMLSALRGLRAADAPNDMGEALRLAGALVGGRPGGRIVVVSDGTFPAVKDFSAGKAEVTFQRVGETARNVGITAFDAADAPNGAMEIFAAVHNFDASPRKATVAFTVDGRTADAAEITIPARQTTGRSVHIPAGGKRAEVTVSMPGDILASDNRAALYLRGAGTVRALLVTSGDLFLERALALEPSLRLDRAPSVPEYERAGSRGDGRYDLVIFDGVPAEAVKAPAVCSFGGTGPGLPVDDLGPSSRPSVSPRRREHPLFRHVDMDGALIQKARKVAAKPAADTLLDGSDGPLIVAADAGGRRSLYLAWSPLDSDFPLRVSFPIFVGNAVAWLTREGASGADAGLNVRTGRTFSVPSNAARLDLKRPDGSSETVDGRSGAAVLRTVDAAGEYRLTGPKTDIRIAANVLDEAQSDVAPRSTLDFTGGPVAARSSTAALAENWRPLILLALLVLAGEWWWFVRKS